MVERVYTGSVGTVNEATPEWPSDLEHRARTACVNAFFEDLREIAAENPFVLILDAFEQCREPLRSWIRDSLLRARIIATETRCFGLIVVVAGRQPNDRVNFRMSCISGSSDQSNRSANGKRITFAIF